MNEPVFVETSNSRLKRMRWRVLTAATLHDAVIKRGGHRWHALMVTLTYARMGDEEPRHVSEYIKRVRQWLGRCGEHCRYVWTAELQQRGALHYHVVFWLPHHVRMPKADRRGWWPHGMTRTERAKCGPAYIAKYVSKTVKVAESGEILEIPKGFRISGVGGLNDENRAWFSWCRLPGWLRPLVTSWHRMEPVRGGGWGSRATGEYWPSPWRIESFLTGPYGNVLKLVPAFPHLELNSSRFWPDFTSDAALPSGI